MLRVGPQKQGLPGFGQEVFGGGDVKAHFQNNNPNLEHGRKKSWL